MSMLDIATFSYDPGLECYASTVIVGASPVELLVSDQAVKDREALNARLNGAVALVSDHGDRIMDDIVSNLLELKNENWINSDDETVSAEEFRNRVRLEAVTIEPDGELELVFDDGDLFWGHAIVVRVDAAQHAQRVALEG